MLRNHLMNKCDILRARRPFGEKLPVKIIGEKTAGDEKLRKTAGEQIGEKLPVKEICEKLPVKKTLVKNCR